MRSNSPIENQGGPAGGSQDKEGKRDPGRIRGKLFVLSLGPGSSRYLAPEAVDRLAAAQIIVGYKGYIGLIEPEILAGKEVFSTGMTGEIERCELAIDKVLEGKSAAVVSSGDAGIYGMAGLVMELLHDRGLSNFVEVEVIPGIPALAAAAALLGAPLMHDFAVVSLSDLLTPWEDIRTRVQAAAEADFVLVIYNPRSKRRQWQLREARKILLSHRRGNTPVGIVRNAMREDQSVEVTTLSRLEDSEVDMLTIVLVGNSRTRVLGSRMVTPRGYREKYLLDKTGRSS